MIALLDGVLDEYTLLIKNIVNITGVRVVFLVWIRAFGLLGTHIFAPMFLNCSNEKLIFTSKYTKTNLHLRMCSAKMNVNNFDYSTVSC